jgi:hypothetical protein
VGSKTDSSVLATQHSAIAAAAFGAGELAAARAGWHRVAEHSIGNIPDAITRSARAALWLRDVPAARAELATLDAAGVHGLAVDADRTTIRAGIAALEGRDGEALSLYRDALQAWRDLGTTWDEALCGLDMALLLDPSDPDVRAAAEASREILVRLGAAPFIERLDAAVGTSSVVPAGALGQAPA